MAVSLFRPRSVLDTLSVAAIGCALASLTGAVFMRFFNGSDSVFALASLASTLVFGSLWAWLLRRQKTLGRTGIRTGWLMSVPLAAINGGVGGAIYAMASESGRSFSIVAQSFFLGLSFGVILWGPALIATLVLFGIPIAWGQRLARQGLAGQERGEIVVGLACALLAAIAVELATTARSGTNVVVSVTAVGIMANLLGIGLAAVAFLRDLQRRRFVREVEAGRVTGFRIDAAPEGKVLVRFVHHGEGYRVADFVEEVAALGRDGDLRARP